MPQNKEKLIELIGQYWDIAHSEGATGVSRGDEAGAVWSEIQSLLDQPEGEPVAGLTSVGRLCSTETTNMEQGLSYGWQPLYTHPPAPRQPITAADVTDEMLNEFHDKSEVFPNPETLAIAYNAVNAYRTSTVPTAPLKLLSDDEFAEVSCHPITGKDAIKAFCAKHNLPLEKL